MSASTARALIIKAGMGSNSGATRSALRERVATGVCQAGRSLEKGRNVAGGQIGCATHLHFPLLDELGTLPMASCREATVPVAKVFRIC